MSTIDFVSHINFALNRCLPVRSTLDQQVLSWTKISCLALLAPPINLVTLFVYVIVVWLFFGEILLMQINLM